MREGFDPATTATRSISTIRRRAPSCGSTRRSIERIESGEGAAVIAVAAGDVLAFWREAGPEQVVQEGRRLRRRTSARAFSQPTRRPRAGKLAHWEQTADGALALVIVLDQFPRNMFRGECARLRRRSAGARRRRARARARLRPAGRRSVRPAVFLSAVRAFGDRWPTRSAAARCSARPATPNC